MRDALQSRSHLALSPGFVCGDVWGKQAIWLGVAKRKNPAVVPGRCLGARAALACLQGFKSRSGPRYQADKVRSTGRNELAMRMSSEGATIANSRNLRLRDSYHWPASEMRCIEYDVRFFSALLYRYTQSASHLKWLSEMFQLLLDVSMARTPSSIEN